MRYAELHCLSNFSFLEAASHPEECVGRAAELGYTALAITDRNSLAGVVRAHTAAKQHSLHLLIGSEIQPVDGLPIVLWAMNRQGYANLCRLITIGRRRAVKGDCRIHVSDISAHAHGLIAGVVPPARHETFPVSSVHQYRDIFGEAAHLLLGLHHGPHDQQRLDVLQTTSQQTRLPLVAAGNILFHIPARKPLHDVLTAIRHGTTVAHADEQLQPNAERHLRSLEILRDVYARIPDALHRTIEIADQCTFSLDELRYEYPEELAPAGMSTIEHLKDLTWRGAAFRYPAGTPDRIKKLLRHEFRLIEDLRYEPYFLTVHDLVQFARGRGILCQGRGSAANSAVCYCLGITSVAPERIDLLFERFVSRERDEAPDIDVDFEHERREEVLQYLYQKYGRDRAGLTAVTITYRPRSAIRDVGKALGLSLDMVDRLAKNADHYRAAGDFEQRVREAGLDTGSRLEQQFMHLVNELLGFPRHLSQHVGGMVITRGPLHELVPIENAAMAGRTVVQWNKDDLDDLGILKVDCLALGMLTAIRKCFAMVEASSGKTLTLANIPEGDQATYEMICQADTIGVFQIESRAQMSMLPRLKPRCYYDLVIEVAIVRPGPIQGDMVHPYLRRRCGEEPITYPNDTIRHVLQRTLGIPLFQEQCMQLAMVAAGFTPGEADQLRRAMGAWRRPGVIDQFRQKLLVGMKQHGLQEEFAERVFHQIRGFGEYGFPESHAASFALLVYVSAWLKCHYPAEFTAAVINSQPMGFYAPAQLIQDARNHGVDVHPIDVNESDWDCTIHAGAIRLGFRLIAGFQKTAAEAVVAARHEGPFSSMHDFVQRTRLGPSQVVQLAEADALSGLNHSRRESLWNALEVSTPKKQRTLFDTLEPEPQDSAGLPVMSAEEEVYADYHVTGLSLRAHPMAFRRVQLEQLNVKPIAELGNLQHGAGRDRGRHRTASPAPQHGQGNYLRNHRRRNRHGQSRLASGGLGTLSFHHETLASLDREWSSRNQGPRDSRRGTAR